MLGLRCFTLFSSLFALVLGRRHQYRAEPIIPTVINITTVKGLVVRDTPPISYSFSLIDCVDEINNGPVRVLNHQVPWNKDGVYTCVVSCFNSGVNNGSFGPHYIFAAAVNGDQCWCDNTINVQAKTVDIERKCNQVCENRPSEYCGGSREYQMYYLGKYSSIDLQGIFSLLYYNPDWS